jgi:hypothetical protein
MLKFFRIPFALSGDKTAVPDASQPSGSVSYEDGFGPDYELDPGVDPAAKDVPRDESNQLYFDITTAIAELQGFGTPDFITSALNGGAPFSYAKYARIKWTDNKVYESTVAANVTDPTSSPASWRVITDNVDYLSIATTAFQASVVDGEAVYWDGAQFDEAVADGTNKQNVVGFADVTNGRVFVAGLYSGQLAGMVANTPYYLSAVTPGAITTVSTSQYPILLGIAKSATVMHVNVTPLNATNAGRLLNVQVFTANGTYTPTPGTNSIIAEVQGGGGAGGGAPATGVGQGSVGVAGGAGCYAKGRFTSAFAGLAVTIGAGGTGVNGLAGNGGGTSSLGALISCPGGRGGGVAGPTGTALFLANANSAGVPTGGNIQQNVGAGSDWAYLQTANSIIMGRSAGTKFGPGTGVNGADVAAPAAPTDSYGAGGGSAARTPSLGALAGGAGKSGVVVIWEYA